MDLARAAAPPEVAERVRQALATLAAEPELVAETDALRATLDLTVPVFATPSAVAPAPSQLTPVELAAFEKQLDQWDAFLVFAVKQFADLQNDPKLRDELLALLIDSRHRLIDALANPQSAGPDPVRILFLDEWQQLGEIIRDAARRGTLGNRSLEFLSFISAGDALFALDQAAPALGMRISADDLRSLARIVAPGSTGDPLTFGFQEDPELRKMFQVKEPLESEGPLDTEPSVIAAPTTSVPATSFPTPTGSVSPSASPATAASPIATGTPASVSNPSPAAPPGSPLPMRAPSPASPAAPSPTSMLNLPALLIAPDEACAAEAAPAKNDAVVKLQVLAKKLQRAVVGDDNADEYRAAVGQLLEFGAQRAMAQEDFDGRYRPLYLRIVKSTAWQESCWRQFVRDGNRVVYLESSSHDIGLMQVNKYVWRGFYSVPRLEWDVLYNASAGMEILARLLEDTAPRRGAFTQGQPDELARSVYAGYNGGPGAYRRWRGRETRFERIIDAAFWKKYQAVLRGQQIDILSCAADWSRQH